MTDPTERNEADVAGLVERLTGYSVEGSFYKGMAAAMSKGGRTVAHFPRYPDAVELLSALTAAATELATLKQRTLSDHGRLLWRDDVEGICPTIDSCFEYGDTVRCSPCAIKQAAARGVETNYSLPELPEVSRQRREIATLKQARAEAIEQAADGGWLPIEAFDKPTAPSSGCGVLVADADGTVGEAYYRNFDDDDDGWWWSNTSWGDYPKPSRPTPTHFRPLPPPPRSLSAAQEG
jgi:hypothetical protein